MAKRTTRATTTTRKTTTTRTTRARKSPAATKKSEPVTTPDPQVVKPAEAPLPKVVPVSDTAVAEPELRKRELIDMVVARSDVKKKFAKPAVEAMLEILGEAISEGRELNLQPMGKLRINRVEEKENGRVIICKLRQSLTTEKDDDAPLAEAAE